MGVTMPHLPHLEVRVEAGPPVRVPSALVVEEPQPTYWADGAQVDADTFRALCAAQGIPTERWLA